jgi:hypothetical protein
LRPASQLVTASGGPTDDASNAPLVDVAIEPDESDWHGLPGDDDIVDAELVGEDGRIIAPRNGAHDSLSGVTVDLSSDSSRHAAGEPESATEPSGLSGLTWACKCGEDVSFDETVCPVCGAPFLGDLRDGNVGRHRPGNSPLSWLPESRQVRLAAAAFVAIAFAVLIPVLLTLLG